MKTIIRRRALEQGAWLKKLAIALGILVVLLVVTYFVVTSSAFFKGVILPKVAKSLNADIQVADASISPFSRVELTRLVLKTTGAEPLLTADRVRLRYSLMDIIKGNINVHEVTLSSPVINIVTEPDGTSNLDPLLKKDQKEEEKKDESKGEPTRLSVKNVALQNGTLRQVAKEKDGTVSSTELGNLNVSLDQLGNNQSGTLKIGSDISMSTTRPQGTNDLLQARLDGTFAVALTPDLLPSSIKGQSKVQVNRGEGGFAQVNGLTADLDCDVTPSELRQVALKFAKGSQGLGQIRAYGPLDLATKEGRIQLEVSALDKNILNLAGVGKGWDFRDSTLSTTNQIDISQKGTFFALAGRFTGSKVSIAQNDLVTPEINLAIDYQGSANMGDKTALLQKLNLSGQQQGSEFLKASLDRQMNLSWGQQLKGFKEAALNLVLTNFNLAQWRPVIGTNISSGIVNLIAVLQAQKDGQQLNTEINASIRDLAMNLGTNALRNANVTLGAKGMVEEMKVVNLTSYNFALAQQGQNVLSAKGALRYEIPQQAAQVQTTAELSLPRALELYPVADAHAQSGVVKISANIADFSQSKNRKITGNVGLEQFTGGYQQYAFSNYNVTLDLNTEMSGDVVNLRHVTASFAEGFQKGGSVDITGKYDLAKKGGNVDFKVVELNQHTFKPVLAPSLGENQLVSIVMNASGSALMSADGEKSIKSDLKVSNWVVQDKAGKLPKTPLELGLKLDGGMAGELINLRNFVLQLTPTARAKNELQLQARIDLAKTNASPGSISVQSESLDLTRYYDLFAGGSSTNAAAETTPAGAPTQPATASTTTEQKEPEAMNLPFQNLTANLKLDRFFLRQLAISNWNGTVAIRTNVVTLKPFALGLNGGSMDVGGQVDLGQPGYRYDLTWDAQNVPLEPLVNSFATNSSGQLKGTFISQANISGSGITGSNIQKNLKGSVFFTITNMDYQVVGPKLRKILTPIAAVLRAPELLQTPVNWVNGKTQVGNGTVQLQDVGVQSEAFFAKAMGTIQLAAVLTNSQLNIPLELHLRRSLAEKSKLLPPNTPADAKYAVLPSFVTVKGTLGDPSSDINELAILKLGTIGAANIGEFKEAGKVLQGLDLLSGAGKTNASGTNQNTGGNLLQGIANILGKEPAQTNAPAATNKPAGTAAPPASTNQPKKLNPFDLLKVLPGSEK